MDMNPYGWCALAALYATGWTAFARALFMTHKSPRYEWYVRGHRFRVATGYAFLALLWPLFPVYLVITADYARKAKR